MASEASCRALTTSLQGGHFLPDSLPRALRREAVSRKPQKTLASQLRVSKAFSLALRLIRFVTCQPAKLWYPTRHVRYAEQRIR